MFREWREGYGMATLDFRLLRTGYGCAWILCEAGTLAFVGTVDELCTCSVY